MRPPGAPPEESLPPGAGQPAVTDHVDLPVEVHLPRGDNLSAGREAANAVEAGSRTGQRLPVAGG